jgi:hypothetical protein
MTGDSTLLVAPVLLVCRRRTRTPQEDHMLPIRRWRASHLFRAWLAYWILLIANVAWRPLLEYWRVTHSPDGHGSVTYAYSGSPLRAALWIAGPPLALFVVWVATRTRELRQRPDDVRDASVSQRRP